MNNNRPKLLRFLRGIVGKSPKKDVHTVRLGRRLGGKRFLQRIDQPRHDGDKQCNRFWRIARREVGRKARLKEIAGKAVVWSKPKGAKFHGMKKKVIARMKKVGRYAQA